MSKLTKKKLLISDFPIPRKSHLAKKRTPIAILNMDKKVSREFVTKWIREFQIQIEEWGWVPIRTLKAMLTELGHEIEEKEEPMSEPKEPTREDIIQRLNSWKASYISGDFCRWSLKDEEAWEAIRPLIEKFFEWQERIKYVLPPDPFLNWPDKADQIPAVLLLREIRDFGHEIKEKKP